LVLILVSAHPNSYEVFFFFNHSLLLGSTQCATVPSHQGHWHLVPESQAEVIPGHLTSWLMLRAESKGFAWFPRQPSQVQRGPVQAQNNSFADSSSPREDVVERQVLREADAGASTSEITTAFHSVSFLCRQQPQILSLCPCGRDSVPAPVRRG
jgi:hypothetical protein